MSSGAMGPLRCGRALILLVSTHPLRIYPSVSYLSISSLLPPRRMASFTNLLLATTAGRRRVAPSINISLHQDVRCARSPRRQHIARPPQSSSPSTALGANARPTRPTRCPCVRALRVRAVRTRRASRPGTSTLVVPLRPRRIEALPQIVPSSAGPQDTAASGSPWRLFIWPPTQVGLVEDTV